jgi:hypothetical protein
MAKSKPAQTIPATFRCHLCRDHAPENRAAAGFTKEPTGWSRVVSIARPDIPSALLCADAVEVLAVEGGTLLVRFRWLHDGQQLHLFPLRGLLAV